MESRSLNRGNDLFGRQHGIDVHALRRNVDVYLCLRVGNRNGSRYRICASAAGHVVNLEFHLQLPESIEGLSIDLPIAGRSSGNIGCGNLAEQRVPMREFDEHEIDHGEAHAASTRAPHIRFACIHVDGHATVSALAIMGPAPARGYVKTSHM